MLEGVHPAALKLFKDNGYSEIEISKAAISEDELLKKIKQEHKQPPPVVMMITAYGDSENYQTAVSLGADDFLTKPLDFTILKEKLNLLN